MRFGFGGSLFFESSHEKAPQGHKACAGQQCALLMAICLGQPRTDQGFPYIPPSPYPTHPPLPTPHACARRGGAVNTACGGWGD